MEKAQQGIKETFFDEFPAALDMVTKYTLDNTAQGDIRGHKISWWMLSLFRNTVRSMSWKSAYALGRFFGWVFNLIKIRKRVAMINMDIVFGDTKTTEEKERIYRESLYNLGQLVMNYVRLPAQPPSFWRNNCEVVNLDKLHEAYNKKRGLLFVAAHIGMWDLAGGAIGMIGYPVSVIAKRIKNRVFDKAVIDARSGFNLGTIEHKHSMPRIMDGLRNGEAIAMALDQNMKRSQGVFVEWLGRKASTVRSSAWVQKETGVPVFAVYMVQTAPDRFKIVFSDEVAWEPFPEDPEKEFLINTRKHNHALEPVIYEQPELWFWLHRRWKVQPEGTPNPYEKKT